jgi:surface antigen
MTLRSLSRAAALAALAVLTAACGSTSSIRGGLTDGDASPEHRRADLQCVPFAREESGINIRGDASTWWRQAAGRYPRGYNPVEGAVLVMKIPSKKGPRGHVAVVRRIHSDREIVVDHANWLNDGDIYLDQPVRDVSRENDWSLVRVWYQPGRTWGAKAYAVEGFILPPGFAHLTNDDTTRRN